MIAFFLGAVTVAPARSVRYNRRERLPFTPFVSKPTPSWSGKSNIFSPAGVGRPSRKPKVFYHSFQYQAKSWKRSRRVVEVRRPKIDAKAEWHQDELFPRVGVSVTNLNKRPKNVVKFYNGRGTAEEYPAYYVEGNNLYQGGRWAYSVR